MTAGDRSGLGSLDLGPEDELLLACARATFGDGSVPRSETPIRWGLFARRAVWHGLHGTIYPVVEKAFGAVMPPEIRASLQRMVQAQASHNLRLLGVLEEIATTFQGEDVPYLVLKGLPLAESTYGTITARRCRDLDLLVSPDGFDEARRLLEGIGFTSRTGLTPERERIWLRFAADLPMVRSDPAFVELHHRLEIRPRTSARAMVHALMDSARLTRIDETEVPVPSGPVLLPYLACHGTHHAWFRLFWLLDVAVITHRAPISELEAIWAEAGRLRQRRSLVLAWALSHRYLGVEMPNVVGNREVRRFGVDRLSSRVTRRVSAPVGHAPRRTIQRRLKQMRWDLATIDGLAGKLAYLAEYLVAVQPEDVAAVRLPPRLRWLHHLLRPIRIAWRIVRVLGRRGLPRRREAGSVDRQADRGDSEPVTPADASVAGRDT